MINWQKFFKKNWLALTLGIVILGAFFVRSYNFENWLFFQADQVRDAKLASAAFENGPGDLTLLGPRAAGTFLRLGPIFYYMQYVSTLIFDSIEPHVFAYPDLLFSILTIPLLFFFLRQFFSPRNSILLTTLYSFSFIIIQYSRFGWNPNQTTFWGLLFIFALYKASKAQKASQGGRWLLVVALSYAIASQLHFVAFVGYPIVALLFWIKYFPRKINWKYWVGAVLIGLFFYIPVIASDVYTGGDNFNQFVYAVTAKTGGEGDTLFDKARQISISFSMFLTSFGHKDGLTSTWAGSLIILGGLGSLGYLWKKDKKNRSFIYLMIVWFLVFVALQIKTSTSLKPRFFMPIASVPFVFLGMIYVVMEKVGNKKLMTSLIFISFFGALLLNFNGIKTAHDYFKYQDKDSIGRKIFMKQHDGKVLEKHLAATNYMAEEVRKTGKIACFYASAVYERTYEFLFKVYYPDVLYDRVSKSFDDKDSCQYFSIITVGNDKLIGNSYKEYFDFADAKQFGRVEIWNAIPRENFLNYDEKKDETDEAKELRGEKTDKQIIEELEASLEASIKAINGEEAKQEVEKPDRVERVLWKNIFSESIPE